MAQRPYECRDRGRPGCLVEPDPRYTMDFADIGEGKIFWCTECGKMAQAINASIEHAFKTRPNFAEEFRKAIEKAEEGE